jgi:hypothetical protein
MYHIGGIQTRTCRNSSSSSSSLLHGQPSQRMCNTFDCCSVTVGPTCEICTTDGVLGACGWCAATSTCQHKNERTSCDYWADTPNWCSIAEDGNHFHCISLLSVYMPLIMILRIIEYESQWQISGSLIGFISFASVVLLLVIIIGEQLHKLQKTWHPTSPSTALPPAVANGGDSATQSLLASTSTPLHVDDDTPAADQLRAVLVRYFLLAVSHVAMIQVTYTFHLCTTMHSSALCIIHRH